MTNAAPTRSTTAPRRRGDETRAKIIAETLARTPAGRLVTPEDVAIDWALCGSVR